MSLAYVKSLSSLFKQPLSGWMEPQWVDVQSPLYKPKYFGELVRGMARRHRPTLHRTIAPASAKVKFSAGDLQDWRQFVDQKADHIPSPLTCYNSAGAFCLFKILADLQINFSTILHLRANLQLTESLEAVSPESVYTLKMQLSDVIPRAKQCILVMDSQLLDDNHRVVRQHQDFWFVKNCSEQFLKHAVSLQPHVAEEFRGLSQKTANWKNWSEGEIEHRQHRLQPSAGKHYGRISGDHNIIHTTHWGARLCGQKRPFLQGFGLMNLALHQASQVKKAHAASISITFARPALVDQNLSFYFGASDFEICGENQDLIAFGTYS